MRILLAIRRHARLASPGPPQIAAYLSAVPNDRMIVLDLISEATPAYAQTDSYHGKPYIWSVLHNFGGQIGLRGNLDTVMKRPYEAAAMPKSMVTPALLVAWCSRVGILVTKDSGAFFFEGGHDGTPPSPRPKDFRLAMLSCSRACTGLLPPRWSVLRCSSVPTVTLCRSDV